VFHCDSANGDFYSPMKADNTVKNTEWTSRYRRLVRSLLTKKATTNSPRNYLNSIDNSVTYSLFKIVLQ